ncbi:tripartite tricarboxylate transporter substrate-binding protein [Bordetella sp. BOR01]|uniref:tripartite tricarboxylate transporter substrate-binding protein n=1 Tax=Bordetella sp. BOR01 TaxID=2854779 RepID=UPI00351D4ACE
MQFGVLSLPSMIGNLKSGALRAVGACGTERSAMLPDLPTLREQGLPDYDASGWFAVIAPKELPESKVRTIHGYLRTAFTDPEVKKAMDAQGNSIWLKDPKETGDYFRSEMKKYAAIVRGRSLSRSELNWPLSVTGQLQRGPAPSLHASLFIRTARTHGGPAHS